MKRTITVGTREVGPGRPLYFIAEAGSNHDRKLEQAFQLVDVAVAAGADAVKFQTFRAEALYPRSAGVTDYLEIPKSIFEIIRELEMPVAWIPQLAAYCAERGIDFLSTPFDEASADALAPYVSAIKIASYEMTHHGLVQHCARLGKPLIVSTGTANLDEVGELVKAIEVVGGDLLALLQCTAKYPAPLDALNLRAMTTMQDAFDVNVGLSDHSREPLPGPMAAVAMGAVVIEKHFTLSNKLPGPDHVYALEPHELTDVIAKVREVERALGTGIKETHAAEVELRKFARRSVFTSRAIAEGEAIGVHNASVLRAGKLAYGMHPARFMHVIGTTARHALGEETAPLEEDLAPLRLVSGDTVVRRVTPEDSAVLLAWRQQPEVHAQLFAANPPTPEGHARWMSSLPLRTDRIDFIVEHAGTPVGTINLSVIDLGSKSAEFGILVGDPAVRGKGVAVAASQLVLDFAFGPLALERVRLDLFADNTAAAKLYEKLGFVDESGQPAPKLKDGQSRAVRGMEKRRPS